VKDNGKKWVHEEPHDRTESDGGSCGTLYHHGSYPDVRCFPGRRMDKYRSRTYVPIDTHPADYGNHRARMGLPHALGLEVRITRRTEEQFIKLNHLSGCGKLSSLLVCCLLSLLRWV